MPLRLSTRKPEHSPYPKELKTLGDHLRKKRLDLGLTQLEVGRQLGIGEQCVCNWEVGRSRPKTYLIPRIIEFLGYTPAEPARSFPEILRTFRRAAGLSQERLSQLTRIDESTLANWERGATFPFPSTVERLRRFFKKSGRPLPEFGPEAYYGPERRSEAARKAWRTKNPRTATVQSAPSPRENN